MTTLTIEVDHQPAFVRDMAKDQGWRLTVNPTFQREVISLVPQPILDSKTAGIKLDQFVAREQAKSKRILGQKHGEAIIAFKEKIPPDWKGIHILLPGTVWADGPFLRIPGFHLLYGDHWEMYWRWTELGFAPEDHILTVA